MSKAVKRKKDKVHKISVDEEMGRKDKAFVLFYATWCPFSMRFLPIFEKYAKINPEECMTVIVDERPDLCDRYEIEYYPTVILIRKGRVDKRLDAEPGVGLDERSFADLVENE